MREYTYTELYNLTKGMSKRELFGAYKKVSKYANYEFQGEITDRLIEVLGREPTSNEIIMLVDNGSHNFGASCSISGRRFSGYVNTD